MACPTVLRMPATGRCRTTLVLAVALVALSACSSGSGDGDGGNTPAEPSVSPLASVDTEAMTVARAPFCDRVDDAQVTEALGGEAGEPQTWNSGDRIGVGAQAKDIVHEFGCRWPAASGRAAASAWVFAPPVTEEKAQRLQAAATSAKGCQKVPGAAAFGADSVTTRCQGANGDFVSYRGRFADAWLDCRLSPGRGDDLASPEFLKRADLWCSAVASAASTD